MGRGKVNLVTVVHVGTLWAVRVYNKTWQVTDELYGFDNAVEAKLYARRHFPVGSFYEAEPQGEEDKRWEAEAAA